MWLYTGFGLDLLDTSAAVPRYVASTRTPQKTPLPTVLLLLRDVVLGIDSVENTASHSYSIVAFVAVWETTWSLLSHGLATALSADFTVLAFSRHAIILSELLHSALPQYHTTWQWILNLNAYCTGIALTYGPEKQTISIWDLRSSQWCLWKVPSSRMWCL
jgi:hypothetical protein